MLFGSRRFHTQQQLFIGPRVKAGLYEYYSVPNSTCTLMNEFFALEAASGIRSGFLQWLSPGASGIVRVFRASFQRLFADLELLIIARSESNDILRSSNRGSA